MGKTPQTVSGSMISQPTVLLYNMKSLERLTMEHALVGRGLGALEIIGRRMSEGGDVDGEAVQKLLGFLQIFGDRYHLAKEEEVLLPGLEDGCESGAGCDVGPLIGEIDHQHEVARRLLGGMRRASRCLEDSDGRRAFVRHAEAYISLMRGLMAKEKDTVIRTAASKMADKDRRVERSFGRYVKRESIPESPKQFASELDAVLSELSVEVPPAKIRAYSRGTIPYHRSSAPQIRF